MFKKDILIHNEFCYEQEYYPAEDYMLWVKMASVTKLHNLPQVLLEYKIHSLSISQSNQNLQIEKTNFVRSWFLLHSLSSYSEEYCNILTNGYLLNYGRDIEELHKFKNVLKIIVMQNRRQKIFNKGKLNKSLEEYWYLACAKATKNKLRGLKEYLSISMFLFNIYHFAKLLILSIKSA